MYVISFIQIKHIKSEKIIPSLCNGSLYQKAAGLIFQSRQSRSKYSFLDDLTERGLFNVKKGLKSSVKEIIADSSAFYESIHVNIIEAFMSANTSSITLSDIETELRFGLMLNARKFPKYNQAKISPFDIEDALILFTGQFTQQESSDLVDIVKDGTVFCKILEHYYGEKKSVEDVCLDLT